MAVNARNLNNTEIRHDRKITRSIIGATQKRRACLSGWDARVIGSVVQSSCKACTRLISRPPRY